MNNNNMTNSEYFEKNKISFAEAMEIFNKQKNKRGGTKSFDKFLASEHVEHKFKAGDIVVMQLNDETRKFGWWKHNVVFEVIEFISGDISTYKLKHLTPDGDYDIGCVRCINSDYIDKHCVLY